MPNASWITPRLALTMQDQVKLAQLTNQAGQQEFVGVGDGIEDTFTTPFALGQNLVVYADAVVVADTNYDISIDYADGERVVVTFVAPPGLDVRITASSTDAVNADNLDNAFLRAQGYVTGMIGSALYAVPAPGATNVPEIVLGFAAAIAWYLLASDPRRPRLLEAYPELEKRYVDVYAGIDSDLKRVAKGTFSLQGVLTAIDPSVTTSTTTGIFTSNEPVYTPDRYRGPA